MSKLLTITEAAKLVPLTGRTLRKWCKEGKLGAELWGNRWMIPMEQIEYLKACARGHVKPLRAVQGPPVTTGLCRNCKGDGGWYDKVKPELHYICGHCNGSGSQ